MERALDPDRPLVEAYLRRRDERSFLELHHRHSRPLYRFAVLRVGVADAEEVVQETWVRALRGLAGFRWRSSLRSWLIGIALNCCRERARTRRVAAVELPGGASEPDPGTRIALGAALSDLPERARDVLLLHDVEGFTHREIGEVLAIDAGTSKSQLSRARRLMRERLLATGS